jgi:hypothetical protein
MEAIGDREAGPLIEQWKGLELVRGRKSTQSGFPSKAWRSKREDWMRQMAGDIVSDTGERRLIAAYRYEMRGCSTGCGEFLGWPNSKGWLGFSA